MLESQLSKAEIVLIESFCDNKPMFDAVKKGLLAGIYSHGVIKAGYEHDPLQNGALSLAALATTNPIPDEQLGQHIRGIWAGLNALENAVKELQKIKSDKGEVVESPYNEAI
jgi:hypothetical protein